MFFDKTDQGIILRVRLSPNSSCCKVLGTFTTPDNIEFIKISVISVPEKGKANKELINWLSKMLNIAKSDFTIITGELDKYKKLLITSEPDLVIRKLNNLVPKE